MKLDAAVAAYATVISALAEATLIVTPGGEIRAANARTGQLLRCSAQSLTGRNLAELVERPEKLAEFLRSAARSGTPLPGGLSVTDAEGRKIPCRWEGGVLAARPGAAEALVLVRIVPKDLAANRFVALNLRIDELSREIGRRQSAEAALREQREWLLVTLSSIGDAVIATDAQGKISFMNPVAEAQTGWPQAEAAGRALDEVFVIQHETTRAPVESPVARVLREGRVVGLANHTVLVARDGTVQPIDDSGAPIRDASGEMLGVVLVFRDIAERRAIERERAEADRRKDEFLAMLAHELRNPLAVLGSGIEYVRAAPAARSDPAMAQLGEAMQRQLRQLARLVDELLDVSRISTGKIVLHKARVPLQAIVQEAIATSEPALAARDIRLQVALPAQHLVLDADAARLAQVFANLIGNAIKFSEPGGTVGVEGGVRDDGRAFVRVRDAGAGIAPGMLKSVFELFVQADSTLARPQGGLGVGLTIAKRITELHGGSIEARSAGPGRGSEFLVVLPLGAPQAAAQPAEARDTVSGGAKRRILVVDDNVDAAASLSVLLELSDHQVETAHDGEAALRLARAFQPEVVLLDIGMPGMDGYEVARRLRQGVVGSGTRIIALSGYGAESDRKRSKASGFDHHLVKPVEIEALDRLL